MTASRRNFYNTKKQAVGFLNTESKVYRTKRKKSKHLLIVMDAWGLDQDIADQLAQEGCVEIRVLDEESGDVYSVSFELFMDKGIAKNFVGPQLFLPRKYWELTEGVYTPTA